MFRILVKIILWIYFRYFDHVNLSLFFQTAVFMVQALQLLLYFHDFHLQPALLLLNITAFLLHTEEPINMNLYRLYYVYIL